jgi:DNA-binding transcriptional ArsR family regulator
MSSPDADGLRAAVLAELAAHPHGIPLPRLCKRLGVRMSVLSRELAWLGEDAIAGTPGAGLVRVVHDGDRQLASLTDAGRRHAGA